MSKKLQKLKEAMDGGSLSDLGKIPNATDFLGDTERILGSMTAEEIEERVRQFTEKVFEASRKPEILHEVSTMVSYLKRVDARSSLLSELRNSVISFDDGSSFRAG